MPVKVSKWIAGVSIITAIPILLINVGAIGLLGWVLYSAYTESVVLGIFLTFALIVLVAKIVRFALGRRKKSAPAYRVPPS